MEIKDLHLELRGPQNGLSLFEQSTYIATYQSSYECVLDLIYRFGIDDISGFIKDFENKIAYKNISPNPYVYRGICTEMFWPTDTIFKYVYYANTLTELFEKFAFHERRALRFEDLFTYGVQGTGIHLFNNETMQYELWLGGTHIKTVSDVMEEVKSKNLSCPTALEEEYKLSGAYDVFLSHKSTNYKAAKMIYDYLSSKRKKVFLSEVSLPALSNADYTEEINDALCNCQNMVVLVNSIEDVSTGWIKYEWSSFLNEKNSGRKSGNIVTVVMDGIKADELPFALRQFEVISFKDYEKVINYLDI